MGGIPSALRNAELHSLPLHAELWRNPAVLHNPLAPNNHPILQRQQQTPPHQPAPVQCITACELQRVRDGLNKASSCSQVTELEARSRDRLVDSVLLERAIQELRMKVAASSSEEESDSDWVDQ